MKGTVLITGASSGIGLALAEVFAEHGHPLVLIARNKEKLERAKVMLEEKYPVHADVFAFDLHDPAAPEKIFDVMEAAGIPIEILVNNAGFSEYGPFAEAGSEGQLNMIALNITAVTHLTHLFVRKMLARRSGKILNVASTAAFQPGPRMAVYYASKAYVLSFSEAVREELRGAGVSVTALCPGPTDTDFFEKQPEMLTTRLIHNKKLMSAEAVAKAGYRGLMQNKTVVIPGFRNAFFAWAARIGPMALVTKISGRLLGRDE